ncbi:MAM and LDL-receptor class A domain-containing protein 2-like isoform X2 [Daphnia carinata]|uniref:MAM and LDL-receptor class A domain-containing protein 2-like isoform X2 n=1 Tax=Daphnia carinata TaxID=120202 RepID=UPI00286886E9|nr:MAM and LDL-receptor class A domain-containing protein 2-like isoform X2 [Daphnia carinata]
MVTRRNRMYPTFMLIIVIIAVSGAYSQQFGGNNSKRNDREPCSKVVLKNGKTKLRSSGRVVKFNCNRDYVLVGESTSTCLLGEWTSEAPVCATKGCPSIPPPPSGRFIASNGGAVMRLECNPGYRPSHSPMIYCVDRFDWNGTAPTCEASGVHESATRCDFENDDLCGWVQDTTTDEFDWTWQNYGTPSSHLSTGPSFDHTLGQGKGGHYLFIESSSPRILNDTARLFSPVYGPPESSTVAAEGVCFAFWFHMYGSTIGQLNVYVKPESKKMTELRPAFVRSGDQGDKWKQGYISLDRVTENFQVVIEGVRGNGYVGDSAIDDVQLAKGEECLAALKRMMTDTVVPGGSTVQPSSTAPPNASCASRCSTTADQQPENTNTTSWMCGCSDDCLLKNSCCSDYAAFCLTGTSVTSTAKATTDERESAVTTTAGLLQTTTLATTTLATTTLATTLATTTTTQPPIASSATWTTAAATTLAVSTTPFLTPTSTASTTTAFSTSAFSTAESSSVTTSTSLEASSTTITRPTTRFSTTLTSTIPTVTTTTTSTAAPSTTTAIKQTTRNPTTTTTLSADTLRPTLVPTTTTGRTTSATTTSTTTRPTTVSTWTVTPSSRPTSTTTTSLLVPDDPSQDGLQGDDVQSGMAADDPSPSTINQTSSPTWFTGAVVAAAVGMAVLLMLAVAGAVMRSRRAVETGGGGLNGRRPRRPKMRSSHHQDQLAEDSDVRYLRDEDDVQLDLTEATPSSKSAASSQRQFADFERL